jgi:hypothetical protein
VSTLGRKLFQVQIGINQGIPGWEQGLLGMKGGGEREASLSRHAWGMVPQGQGSTSPLRDIGVSNPVELRASNPLTPTIDRHIAIFCKWRIVATLFPLNQ